MIFSKNNKIDKLMYDLDMCGDKYCGTIITSNQIKEEDMKFLQLVNKKCRSNSTPKNEREQIIKREKYKKCFTKLKKYSKYSKRLTKRKKCEDKNCKIYQKNMNSFLKVK